ncbi:MAG TPA: thiol peroxidase [Flavobacteriaceae bacterium]|nr:thiol peroxidase [Flavobacteriaceae bacterium]
MATVTLDGKPAKTIGNIPEIGSKAKNFTLTATDLSTKTLEDFENSKVILNIFPSVGTGVCSAAVRAFNEKASSLQNAKVLCISKDLPFAQKQFCAAEGLNNVIMLSDFKTTSFGKDYGVLLEGSAFDGLLARCVIVLNKNREVVYTELVSEIGNEPNYNAAVEALNNA